MLEYLSLSVGLSCNRVKPLETVARSPHLGEVARAFLERVTELCGAAFLAEESILFYSIRYCILFYSIRIDSILFHSILFYSIPFYSILFYSILFQVRGAPR